MTYQVAEKFKSIQGEGLYSGTPMAFIRFVGCSVGKQICHACDTDFDKTLPWRGGGVFTASELLNWVGDHRHVCLTGGEPLDQDLTNLLAIGGTAHDTESLMFHVETSGTLPLPHKWRSDPVVRFWICVSPKPGFLEQTIAEADELKVIVPGLGEINDNQINRFLKVRGSSASDADWTLARQTFRWPTLDDAKRWAIAYPNKPIFLQPRNGKFDIDHNNLRYVMDLLAEYPQFRLSDQLHKILKVQ